MADRLGEFLKLRNGSVNSLVDSSTDSRWIATGSDVSQAFLENGASQYGCGRGSIAGQVAGFLSDFVDQLGPHVLETVFEFDFFGDGHAVFGDGWTAKAFVDDDVATGWSHGHGNSISEFFYALQHPCTSLIIKKKLLSHASQFLI